MWNRFRHGGHTAERQARDVDPMRAQDCADSADHTGPIMVGDYDQVTRERQFDVDAVQLRNAWRLAVDHRAACAKRDPSPVQRDVNRVALHFPLFRHPLCQPDSPLFRRSIGIDDIDELLRPRLQSAGDQ